MKKSIIALAAAFILSAAPSAFAQLTNSPLEPGLYEYCQSKLPGVALVDSRHISTDAVDVEWVSPEQITISATVTSNSNGKEAEEIVSRFNDQASVGTMKIEGKSIELVHHVNPKLVRQDAIVRLIVQFTSEVNRQKKEFGELMAAK